MPDPELCSVENKKLWRIYLKFPKFSSVRHMISHWKGDCALTVVMVLMNDKYM